jgi:two-component system, OmpR family, sensor kinase
VRPFAARAWRSVIGFSARIPLRVKLITATLALVAIALAVISAVSIVVFHGYLLRQADQQLRAFAQGQRFRAGGAGVFGGVGPAAPGRVAVEILDSTGKQLVPTLPTREGGSLPAIPASSAWISAHAGQLVTVPARSSGNSWRVIVQPFHYTVQRYAFVPTPDNLQYNAAKPGQTAQTGTLVVGIDLGTIGHTIGSLTVIDLAISGIVIVLLAGVGVALVRASLRPLAEIEQTAGAIAAGDLSRRVPDRDPRTEVGSLGRSLNIMLGQIEHAFRARSASEATARYSEERMRRFVADASHELRTPLSVIRGFAEYYRQRGGLKERELDRMIKRVEDEAARMGVLVEDLLLLARLDQQRPVQRKPVDLLALAADAVQDARVLAPGRDIRLRIGSDGAFLVLGDEARLRQIVGNLMSNALTHTPDGTPVRVGLRSAATPGNGMPQADGARRADSAPRAESTPQGPSPAAPQAAGQAVVLEVTDFGPGLSAQQAERVFERFYRADAARTRKTGGTGLGLAIVDALTAAHGGVASVESEPGKGATFRITLPMAPDAVSFGDPPPPNEREAALKSHRTRRL